MAVLTRITDFIPSTLIESQEVDDEFNQLVNLLSGVSTNKDALIKYSHATDPVLRVDQLAAGLIQQWLQNGSAVASMKGNGQLLGYARTVRVDSATTGNVGTGLDTLHTFSLPANSLAADGDYLEVWYGGNFAANDNDKHVNALFGGQTYESMGSVDIDGAVGWVIAARIMRTSATTVRASNLLICNNLFADSANAVNTFGSSGFVVGRSNSLTVANLTSNATTMEVKGETAAASDNDVVQHLSIIKLVQNT